MAKKKKTKSAGAPSAVPAVDPAKIKKDRRIALICLLTVLGLLLISAVVYAAIQAERDSAAEAQAEAAAATSAEVQDTQQPEESAEAQDAQQPEESAEPEPSAAAADPNRTYIADISVENYGTITVELDASAAPVTVQNFVDLAQQGFYDGLTFHRIMDGFMMQGGDPTGTGSGDSGTNIPGEFSSNGWNNPLSHTRGAISMARAKSPDSASCQFFIVQSDSTFLDGDYACFGYVTEGMEYVDAICADAEPTDNNGTIPAEKQPVITSIVIRSA